MSALPRAEVAPLPNPAVLELRQYTHRAGGRDRLIALFESTFQDALDAVGAHVLGTFRDLDDPDRFVWWRGFADRPSRLAALTTFYDGAVWKRNRDAANATMVDSDNVLLLRVRRWDAPASENASTIVAGLHAIDATTPERFDALFTRRLAPALAAAGATVFATAATDPQPNDFVRHPVRTGESVFAWFARLADGATRESFEAAWRTRSGWRDDLDAASLRALARKPELLWLAPTARSPIR